MRLAVHDEAGDVLIELSGIAGRHLQVLKVLAELRDGLLDGIVPPIAPPAELAVRSGADGMKIRLRSGDRAPIPADAIYGLLRRLLVGHPTATSMPQAPSP